MRQGTVERWQRGRSRQGGFRMKEDLSEKKKKLLLNGASCVPTPRRPTQLPAAPSSSYLLSSLINKTSVTSLGMP